MVRLDRGSSNLPGRIEEPCQVGCPFDKEALGDGLSSGQAVAVSVSTPSTHGQWWYVTGKNISASQTAVAAYVICAYVG